MTSALLSLQLRFMLSSGERPAVSTDCYGLLELSGIPSVNLAEKNLFG